MQFWIMLNIPFYWIRFAVPKSYKITIVSFLYARLGSLERCAHECSGRGVCPSRSTWWRQNFVVRFICTFPSCYPFLAPFFCLHIKMNKFITQGALRNALHFNKGIIFLLVQRCNLLVVAYFNSTRLMLFSFSGGSPTL